MDLKINRNEFKTEKGKQLYDLLVDVWNNSHWLIGVFSNLKSDEKKQKMIDILKKGETDRSQIVLLSMAIDDGEI